MRYYQAALDVSELDSGDDYDQLPESCLLFVRCEDAVGRGLPACTLERVCPEEPDAVVGDDAHWLVLNAGAWRAASDGELRDPLYYATTSCAEGLLSRGIEKLVAMYNEDRKWANRVLTFERDTHIRCKRAKEEGREEDREEG